MQIVIDFTASWCPPCRMIAPVFADLAKKFMSSAIFFKVDVDELQVNIILMFALIIIYYTHIYMILLL